MLLRRCSRARLASAFIRYAVSASAFGVPVAAVAATPVGYTAIAVHGNTALRGDPSGRLSVIVWYPARAGTAQLPINVGPPGGPYFTEGQAAWNAPLVDLRTRLPLIVVSHGTGGTAMDLAWLCVGLAARGFMVAAVNHPGNNALQAPTVAGNTVWWLRADDLSRTIDGLFAAPQFGSRIDRARIGAAGVSLGGYAVLVLAGARADSRRLVRYCARKPLTPVCSGEAAPAIPNLAAKARALAAVNASYRMAVAANMASHRDARVKAIVSIEPAEGPAIVPQSLTTIGVPIAFAAGLGDRILPLMDNVMPDALAVRDAQVTLFAKPAGHDTFLMDCTLAGRRKYAPLCQDAGPARRAIHAASLQLAAAFFARTLGSASRRP